MPASIWACPGEWSQRRGCEQQGAAGVVDGADAEGEIDAAADPVGSEYPTGPGRAATALFWVTLPLVPPLIAISAAA